MEPTIIRTRRRTTWWEPTYAPELENTLTQGSWLLPDNGAHERVFLSDQFIAETNARPKKNHFTATRFTSCDFTGRFDQVAVGTTFFKCRFENCDFGTSTWAKVKFRECQFVECSLSQSTWTESEFRECYWERIGLSGNETVLRSVFIDNPDAFIAAAYTNTNESVLRDKMTSVDFQLSRLEDTKATVARSIFNSHKTVGDDATFYKAFSTYACQYNRSLASTAKYNAATQHGLSKVKWLFRAKIASMEGALTKLFGKLTDWGSSALTPLLCMMCSLVVFTAIYRLLFFPTTAAAMQTSFDITFVAGFTRSVTLGSPIGFYLVASLHLLISIIFYSAFFSVAINKISRVR